MVRRESRRHYRRRVYWIEERPRDKMSRGSFRHSLVQIKTGVWKEKKERAFTFTKKRELVSMPLLAGISKNIEAGFPRD